MRIAFLILLLANFIALLWQTQISASFSQEPKLPQIPAKHQLVLVKEFQTVQQRQAGQIDSDRPAQTKPTIDLANLELPDIEITDPEPESESSIEAAAESGTNIAAVEIAPEPEPVVEPPASLCYTLGPFNQLAQSNTARKRLENINAQVRQRSKVEQEQYGYRVYLTPYGSREKALAAARRLAETGIRDYYIISDDPDYKNGISLGLFRKKSGAVRRMAQVRRFDFKPQMEIRYRDTTIYWLDYEHAPDIDSQTLWRELAEENPVVQRLDREC